MKNKRGITLIALIITIIVLLILAGVTMSFVVGDNGVLTQAQKAKIRTDKESAEEEVKLEVVGSYDDEGNLDLDLLNKNLMSNLKDLKLKNKTTGEYEDFTESNKIENLPATVYYKQNKVTINAKQLISDVAKNVENYGMYVNYPIDLDGDKKTSDWKIFYEDETGRVFLIAADYVPNNNNALQLAQGIKEKDTDLPLIDMFDDTVTGLFKAKMSKKNDSICCSFWAEDDDAEYHCYDGYNKDLNSNKAQCSFPEIFMLAGDDNEDEHTNNHYYCSSHTSNVTSRCASALQCTGNWSSFVDGKYGEYAIGGPTLEMWVASWNQKYGKDKCDNGITLFANGNNNSTDKRGYYIGSGDSIETCTSTTYSITSCTEGYRDKLYFPHQSYSGLNLFEENESSKNDSESENASCYGYWLASPSANTSNYCLLYVYCSGSVNGSYSYNGNNVGVRPVVSLNSGVYVEVQEEVKKGDNVIKSCTLAN